MVVGRRRLEITRCLGFKLYERRNSLKNLKINPLNPFLAGSTRKQPENLSPSILDFPALVLSPVTPLIPDPFDRSGSRFSSIPMSGGATPAGNVWKRKKRKRKSCRRSAGSRRRRT
ncbi:VQ motif-containing protein 4 [Linum perenne]